MAIFNPSLVKQEDITRTQDSLRAILSAKYPDLSTSPGTTVDNILVQATSYLAALFLSEAEDIRSRLTVSGLSARADVTGVRGLEDLASNWLVDVRASDSSRGIVTLELSQRANFTIPGTIQFNRNTEGLLVTLSESESNIQVLQDDLIESVDANNNTVYLYRVVCVNSSVTPEQSLSPGSFTTTAAIPFLSRVYNTAPFLPPSRTQEQDLVSRIRSSVTSRGFSTYFSSIATLRDSNIPGFKYCVPVGAGDPEMARDINRIISAQPIHTLGMSNIVIAEHFVPRGVTYSQYISIPLATNLVLSISGSSGIRKVVSFFVKPDGTYLKISRESSESSIGSIVATLSYPNTQLLTQEVSTALPAYSWDKIYSPGIDSTPSPRLAISKPLADELPTRVVIAETQVVGIVKQLVEDDTYRPIGVSTRAQSATLVSIKPSTLVLTKAANILNSDISISLIKTTITNLVNNWDCSAGTLSSLEITSTISALFSGFLTSVSFYDGISFLVHLPDGRDLLYKTNTTIDLDYTEAQIVPNILTTSQLLDLQVSTRTSTLNLLADDLIVELV